MRCSQYPSLKNWFTDFSFVGLCSADCSISHFHQYQHFLNKRLLIYKWRHRNRSVGNQNLASFWNNKCPYWTSLLHECRSITCIWEAKSQHFGASLCTATIFYNNCSLAPCPPQNCMHLKYSQCMWHIRRLTKLVNNIKGDEPPKPLAKKWYVTDLAKNR